MAALLTTVLLTIALGLVLRKKLSRSYRRFLDEAERGREGVVSSGNRT